MNVRSDETITPFYFGVSGKSLYGCYHAPQSGKQRRTGIVLCYPLGHEYIHAHRAFRQLAMRLARDGFPVLRFDYFACGDSEGESDQGNIEQWIIDISQAVQQVRDLCKITSICLIGMRLGASLSLLVAEEQSECEYLVLWDPIVNGSAYLHELLALRTPLGTESNVPEGEADILGFPLGGKLQRELGRIDLLKIHPRYAKQVLIVDSHVQPGYLALQDHLQNQHIDMNYTHLPGPPVWIREGVMIKAWIPSQIVDGILSWAQKACA